MSDDDLKRLNDRIDIMEEAIQLLTSDCSCTVKERMSGHLVDCPIPHVWDLLKSSED
jgi:hypothetical protein